MSVDPINPDQTSQTAPAEGDESAPGDTAAYTPAVGDVVRLDDPAQDGEPRYALYVGEKAVLPLENVQRYELDLFPAS